MKGNKGIRRKREKYVKETERRRIGSEWKGRETKQIEMVRRKRKENKENGR